MYVIIIIIYIIIIYVLSSYQHTSACVSMRQHTSAYVSIRQHTSTYVSIRQHMYYPLIYMYILLFYCCSTAALPETVLTSAPVSSWYAIYSKAAVS